MKIVYVRKVKGSGLTKTQKALLGTSAALLGVAGAAALARNLGPQPTNLDRAVQDLAAQRLNATIAAGDSTNPRYTPQQAKKQVMQDQIARSAYLAQQYGMPPARSYDEIMGIKELPREGDSSRLRPDQLRKRPVR